MDTLEQFTRILSVALGIGLVIFVHELGHFLAARWCKVRVEVFSIGFGPALLSWRRGHTVYKLALVPLGGYVKMAGDETLGESAAAGPPEPWALPSKTVGQRFFIYSGGVLMNLAFAVVVFPILFAIGVPFLQPLLGEPAPGSPAWQAGLDPGTRVLSVDGDEVYDFNHIPTAVALGNAETVELVVVDPGSETPRRVRVARELNENLGFSSIGVAPGIDPEHRITVPEGSAAWEAGLRSGDRWISFEGAPGEMGIQTQLYVLQSRGGPLTMQVQGPEGQRRVTIEPGSVPSRQPRMGIQPPAQHVVGLRENELVHALGLEVDDRIEFVDGLPVWRLGDLWLHLAAGQGERTLQVRRDDEPLTLVTPALSPAEATRLAQSIAVVSDVESTVILIEPGSAAEAAGLQDGDRVTRLAGAPVEAWDDVRDRVADAAARGESVAMVLERLDAEGNPSYLDPIVTPAFVQQPDYGFALRGASYVYSVDNPLDALKVGVACSWKLVEDSWFMLRGILGGRVSAKHVGGIITIGAVSYELAGSGWAKLLFFLCMLSVNLAFLNALPIPVLDGGHLFFLIVEKLKGSPVSERVLGYSQMVGLVLILSLMVYVTFNDIARWFFNT